jgi:hypothetical protein
VPARADPQALAALARRHADYLPSLRTNLRMRAVAALADTLAGLADVLSWPRLAAHAAALAQAVDSFDVPAIRLLLDDCPMPEVAAE